MIYVLFLSIVLPFLLIISTFPFVAVWRTRRRQNHAHRKGGIDILVDNLDAEFEYGQSTIADIESRN